MPVLLYLNKIHCSNKFKKVELAEIGAIGTNLADDLSRHLARILFHVRRESGFNMTIRILISAIRGYMNEKI